MPSSARRCAKNPARTTRRIAKAAELLRKTIDAKKQVLKYVEDRSMGGIITRNYLRLSIEELEKIYNDIK